MIDLPNQPGFHIKELTSAELPKFIDLGVHTCAFMHGRDDMPAEKMRQYFTAFVRDYAFTADSEIFFIESAHGEYVGQLWLHRVRNVFNRRHELWIWDLTVAEPFRKRGFGRELIQFARTRAVEQGCTELWLLVSSANEIAVRLYESSGLKAAGHLMSVPIAQAVAPSAPEIITKNATLRILTPKDIRDLYNLWEKAGLPYKVRGRDRLDRLARHLSGSCTGGWGCWADGKLVAAAIVSHDGRKGWIERLATDPDYRRTGFGKALIAACLDSLRVQGVPVTGALIGNSNTASRKLFEACGFVCESDYSYYSIRDNPDA
ncbi:MAG: GNAT family N-acetyltransferase [Calditrichota bacterium]